VSPPVPLEEPDCLTDLHFNVLSKNAAWRSA